jgi:hypothetical protein
MQDGCKVYMVSYVASNVSCFMGTWIISKNHLLEVGLTQNHWETTTQPLVYSMLSSMIGENQQLVTNEPVEFEK